MTEAEILSDIDPVLRRRDPNASEATSPLWVYVAGPMRGIAEFNFPAFEEATTQLRSRGYKVISPAEQDLGRGFDPSGLTGHEDLSSLGFDLRQALVADLNHIAYECDAICLLPGWEDSKGARAELALAVALGLSAGTLASFESGTLIPAQDFANSLRTQDDIKHQFEAMTEHEFLTGSIAPALNDLVPQVWASAYGQAEKDRDARLDRLDAFLNGHVRQASLFDRYGVVDTPAVPAAGAVAARIGLTGPCERRVRHDPHIETTGVTDTDGNIVLHECPGQGAECANCEDRKCMSCIFREVHDECRDDCPDCCDYVPVLPVVRDGEVRVTSSTGGQKGKKLARYDLIPVHPLWDVAELYGRGALKYEDRGWERGYDWSLSYAALMRHLQQFWDGESLDTETHSPHLAAVVFHALALLEFSATHPEFDDRPGVSK